MARTPGERQAGQVIIELVTVIVLLTLIVELIVMVTQVADARLELTRFENKGRTEWKNSNNCAPLSPPGGETGLSWPGCY